MDGGAPYMEFRSSRLHVIKDGGIDDGDPIADPDIIISVSGIVAVMLCRYIVVNNSVLHNEMSLFIIRAQ